MYVARVPYKEEANDVSLSWMNITTWTNRSVIHALVEYYRQIDDRDERRMLDRRAVREHSLGPRTTEGPTLYK